MKVPKVSFYTLGCRVNQYETQAMEEQFIKQGFDVVGFGEKCDFCVVNTCAVTAESERKSAQLVRRASAYADRVIVVGCHSQFHPSAAASIPSVALVLGCRGKTHVAAAARALADGLEPVIPEPAGEREYELSEIFTAGKNTARRCRAFIKIQDGCSGRCTYCIIPSLRGPSRSRPPQLVLEEARRAADMGIKELVLTGIETAAYSGMPLPELIARVAEISGILRIRLGSLDPARVTPEFVSALAATGKFMPHFHLSVQSGSDRVLGLMQRPYGKEGAYRAAYAVREAFDNAMISADMIYAFPGENDDDFNETLEYIERCDLYHVHFFPFSPRAGTPAAKMKDILTPEEKKARGAAIADTAAHVKSRVLDRVAGSDVRVLAERTESAGVFGHTENFLPCVVHGTAAEPGSIITAHVTGSDGVTLEADALWEI